jgi:hypothetical protein
MKMDLSVNSLVVYRPYILHGDLKLVILEIVILLHSM